MDFKVMVADESHVKYSENICEEIAREAAKKNSGLARRDPEYINEKILAGKAIIALSQDDKFAGFSYIECWEHSHYVANSGLIVAHEFRGQGLSRLIKEKTFELSRTKFPNAKVFTLTTSGAVMRLNYEFGFRPVPFSELTTDLHFWAGCEGCSNFDILKRNKWERCLCSGLLFDPNHIIKVRIPEIK